VRRFSMTKRRRKRHRPEEVIAVGHYFRTAGRAE